MEKKQYKKLNKASKRIGIIGCFIGIGGGLICAVFLILSIAGVLPISRDSARTYTAKFSVDGVLVSNKTYYRGEKLEKPAAPSKPTSIDGTTYTFSGWDITGDKLPDILPRSMYYSFDANACFIEFNPHGGAKYETR